MADTTSGALPGPRAGSFTLRPAGPGTGFSTRNLLGTKAAPLTDPWSGEDDDTHYGYDDTLSGSIWRPAPTPGSLRRPTRAAGRPARSPAAKRRPACDRPGRGACPLP
jgi:hypothetical protein